MAKQIASILGKPIQIPSSDDACKGISLHIRVEVDVFLPLKRGLRLILDNSGTHQDFFLRYKHLHDFCYFRGRLGQMNKDYFDVEARTRALEGSDLPFGDRMRFCLLITSKDYDHVFYWNSAYLCK